MIADVSTIRLRTWVFVLASVAILNAASSFVWDDYYNECARDRARQYAYEAFPAWVAANPTEEGCPSRLSALNRYLSLRDTDTIDPWGTHYFMVCTNIGPIVGSAGEDTKFGTADDLWSNR